MNLCESKLAGFDKNLKEYEQKQSEEINIKIKEIDKKIEELMNGPKQSIDYFQRQYYELNSDKLLIYYVQQKLKKVTSVPIRLESTKN